MSSFARPRPARSQHRTNHVSRATGLNFNVHIARPSGNPGKFSVLLFHSMLIIDSAG